MEDIVVFFAKTQRSELWRYPGGQSPADKDLSATQYALMGLLTAGRLGMHCEPGVYRKALGEILNWQEKSGPEVPRWIENEAWEPGSRYPRFQKSGKATARGWSYQGKGAATSSMTCAGLTCLAVIKDRLSDESLKEKDRLTREEGKAIDKALIDGIAWLSHTFTVERNNGNGPGWHYYYLYGLERAASLMGIRHLGGHDWYREGADLLVRQQRESGSWPKNGEGAENENVQTAFALLFLKHGTLPTRFREPAVTGGPDEDEGK